MTALVMSACLGVMGLGIDISYWGLVRIEQQRIADVAAIAGALSYQTADAKTAAAAAADIAEINGATGAASRAWNPTTYTLADNQITARIVAGVRNPADKAMQVTVQQSVPLFFSRVLSSQRLTTISASAWAELGQGNASQPCVLALNGIATGGTAQNDVTLSGPARLKLGKCSLRSNGGISITGNTLITVPTGIFAAGTVSVADQVVLGQTPVYQNVGQVTDPYAQNMALQRALSQLAAGQGQSQQKSSTLQPGTFGSLKINRSVQFSPGLYVVNGPISLGGNASITGTGVTIVSSGTVSMNGQASLDLSAPTEDAVNGAVPGILYANTTPGLTLQWNSKATQTLTGVLYAPNSAINMTSSSTTLDSSETGSAGCLEIIAGTVSIVGKAHLAGNCGSAGAGGSGGGAGSVALVQ